MTEPYVVDKSKWGPGVWQAEPDRVDFIHAGFACLALRHPGHGYWCGYVGVPPAHPFYGKVWSEAPVSVAELGAAVNYSALCSGLICHEPAPGMSHDVWWFGFDFGHAFDLAPGSDAAIRELIGHERFRSEARCLHEVYRALPYVRRVIVRVADALAAFEPEILPEAAEQCDECGGPLVNVAGGNVRALLCPVCDADSQALTEDERDFSEGVIL